MEVKVIELEKNRIKFEIIGETHTLPNLITRELYEDDNVEFAGYNIAHPNLSNPVIILEMKSGDAKNALISAINRLNKKNNEFLNKLKALS